MISEKEKKIMEKQEKRKKFQLFILLQTFYTEPVTDFYLKTEQRRKFQDNYDVVLCYPKDQRVLTTVLKDFFYKQ